MEYYGNILVYYDPQNQPPKFQVSVLFIFQMSMTHEDITLQKSLI